MSVLNIFDAKRNANTGWNTTDKLNESAISQLKDRSAKTTNALNAVPSPFSRLHTFDTAFKLVTRDLLEEKDRASGIYKELVSDCLDAIELAYNAKYHESQGDKLTFVNWSAENLNALNTGVDGQKVLSKTLKTFIKEDFDESNFQISFLKYKGLVIAGTSPFTIAFTTSNLDKSRANNPEERFRSSRYSQNFDLTNPNSNSVYFTKNIPFSKRSKGFKNYLISLFEKNSFLKSGATKVLWDYMVAEGANDFNIYQSSTTNNVADNGGVFSLGKVAIDSNADLMSTEIFNDHIIRVNYKINDTAFYTPKYKIDPEDRNFDFLLPVKEEFFRNFDPKKVQQYFTYELIGVDRIKVIYDNGEMEKPKIKEFKISGKTKTEGKIVQIDKDLNGTFLIGIFPFLKVVNADGSEHKDYNDFYKVAFSVDGMSNYQQLRTDSFHLDFFKTWDGEVERISEDGHTYNSKREVRRAFETPDFFASIYYQINKTSFDLIKVNLQKVDNLEGVFGLVIPRWKEKKIGNNQYDFSVDFGTTNTFIAYTDDPNHNTTPKPFDIKVNELQMVMLQKNDFSNKGLSVTSSFLEKNNTLIKTIVANEFIPPVFLPNESDSIFNMPFRTAIYQKKNISSFNLFSDLNIHFGYQKVGIDASAADYQEIISNLKWNISSLKDLGSKYRVEKFIEELCMIFKYKVLLNDGNPKLTKLNWFIPQSLSEASIAAYEEIWKEKVAGFLKADAAPKRVYESEAPYYFLERTGQIKNNDSVLSIDIGGGSTDAMLFVNKLPRLGTSFNFAGNILWSNGYNQLTNDAKENGFYLKIKDLIADAISKDNFLKTSMKGYEKKSTDEIINFWLANNDKIKITDYLKNPDFKIVYLLHYCSVIYHLAQLLKSNNYQEPSCVIFSGNGSKYIDFIGTESTLSQITAFIFSKVFEKEIKQPQIILPTVNRKEATSYGGIFKKTEVEFTSKSYLGTTLDFAKNKIIDTYTDVENNIMDIKPNIKANINHMLDIIGGLNDVVNFKSQLNIDFDIASIKNFIESQLDTNFEKGYGIRKEKISYDEKVSDSLFFYPLIGIIFELSKITKEKLTEFTPKRRKYATEPSEDNVFDIQSLNGDRAFNSIYEIAIPATNPNEATFTLINEEAVYQRAYISKEFLLYPVCNMINSPDGVKINIKQHNAGKLRKDGNKWVVTEKLRIEFI